MSETDIMRDELYQQILNVYENQLPANVVVDESGVRVLKDAIEVFAKRPSNTSLDNISRLLGEIPKLYQKIGNGKKFWNTSSYTGALKVQEWREHINPAINNHLHHGDFILAMLLLGYEFRENYTRKYPQLVFNASFRNKIKCVCKCGLEYTQATKLQHLKSAIHLKLIKGSALTNPPPQKKNEVATPSPSFSPPLLNFII